MFLFFSCLFKSGKNIDYFMGTQMTAARRGVATEEMKQVAKDEDVTLEWLIPKIANGSIIIPSNNVRPQKIHNVGIGKGLKTKVNVNIGTSTINIILTFVLRPLPIPT